MRARCWSTSPVRGSSGCTTRAMRSSSSSARSGARRTSRSASCATSRWGEDVRVMLIASGFEQEAFRPPPKRKETTEAHFQQERSWKSETAGGLLGSDHGLPQSSSVVQPRPAPQARPLAAVPPQEEVHAQVVEAPEPEAEMPERVPRRGGAAGPAGRLPVRLRPEPDRPGRGRRGREPDDDAPVVLPAPVVLRLGPSALFGRRAGRASRAGPPGRPGVPGLL